MEESSTTWNFWLRTRQHHHHHSSATSTGMTVIKHVAGTRPASLRLLLRVLKRVQVMTGH